MARALLALLLLTAAVAPAQAREALPAIDDCIARLDNSLDVGYARIAERCPDLTAALEGSPSAAWLPKSWKRPDNQLSASGLGELRALIARATGVGPAVRPSPSTEHLKAVLATLAHSDPSSGGSWWVRFKDFLHRILTRQPRADDAWLARWLSGLNLSRSTMDAIAWSTLALVVALAAWIVLQELRAAGFLGSRAAPLRARQLAQARTAPTLGDIARSAPEEQPRLLLELIAARLAAQGRLPPARALTARELGRRAQLPDESARTALARLLEVCERLRFSGERVAASSLAAALVDGRALIATLEAASAAAPARVS